MQLGNLMNLMIMMFILILLGFVLTRKKIITEDEIQTLTWLVINSILPYIIVDSFPLLFKESILADFLLVFLISLGIQLYVYC